MVAISGGRKKNAIQLVLLSVPKFKFVVRSYAAASSTGQLLSESPLLSYSIESLLRMHYRWSLGLARRQSNREVTH